MQSRALLPASRGGEEKVGQDRGKGGLKGGGSDSGGQEDLLFGPKERGEREANNIQDSLWLHECKRGKREGKGGNTCTRDSL